MNELGQVIDYLEVTLSYIFTRPQSPDEDFSHLWNHSHDLRCDAQPLEHGKLFLVFKKIKIKQYR